MSGANASGSAVRNTGLFQECIYYLFTINLDLLENICLNNCGLKLYVSCMKFVDIHE